MATMEDGHSPGRMTARDLLVQVGGEKEAGCTIVAQRQATTRVVKGEVTKMVEIICRCGNSYVVCVNDKKYQAALRNVPVIQ